MYVEVKTVIVISGVLSHQQFVLVRWSDILLKLF